MRLLGLLSFVTILSACVTVTEHQLPPNSEIGKEAAWELHRATLKNLATWKLKGRVAGKSNHEGFRAGVRWHQEETTYSIDLLGPLGRKVAVINGDEELIELKTSKGETYTAEDAETLMQELFGYSLPINGLRYWMRGIPDPDLRYASLELDKLGKLKQLHQAGWVIEYEQYHDGSPALPAFIKLTSKTLNANLKIDQWTLETL